MESKSCLRLRLTQKCLVRKRVNISWNGSWCQVTQVTKGAWIVDSFFFCRSLKNRCLGGPGFKFQLCFIFTPIPGEMIIFFMDWNPRIRKIMSNFGRWWSWFGWWLLKIGWSFGCFLSFFFRSSLGKLWMILPYLNPPVGSDIWAPKNHQKTDRGGWNLTRKRRV